MSEQCICQSGQDDENCCQPFHLGERYPENAEQLMRSRYAAYVQKNIDYIVTTTVPAQQKSLDKEAMLQWSEETQWDGLDIIQHRPKVDKNHAQVEFKAYYLTSEGRQFHHELSTFTCIDGRWYFLDPTVEIALTMKQPCLCGSGKKFKQCCAPYL
ncbi:YchJ family protein [Acinetobacter populi]|uniref:SEC-C motif-containing protein n=1 Tax=Acinetobacter populi TaxID=1582270 RepID=A0A1Z9YZZ1_9GAMM|nr:YchJ family protein [Acinetobacter populi]OUY07770.1 SEC-C motif-containing protein [Acinetobacter populi]